MSECTPEESERPFKPVMSDRARDILRDQFACAGLTGIWAFPGNGETTVKDMAQKAYQQADAMLEARNDPIVGSGYKR